MTELAILGAGEMGKWFAKIGRKAGWKVTITDVDKDKAEKVAKELGITTSPNNKQAVKGSDIGLVSVPIKETPKVLREISGSLGKNTLLVDIASVKENPVKEMEKIENVSEMASIHPLFGPGADSLEGKNIITVPINTGENYEKFIEFLSQRGANIEEMDDEKHDRLMAVIQGLTHYTILVYLSAFNSMKESDKAIDMQTPMSNRLIELSKAFLKENPKVCGDIQIENPYSDEARNSIIEAAQSLNDALESGDVKAIKDLFTESRRKFGLEDIESAYENLYGEEVEE